MGNRLIALLALVLSFLCLAFQYTAGGMGDPVYVGNQLRARKVAGNDTVIVFEDSTGATKGYLVILKDGTSELKGFGKINSGTSMTTGTLYGLSGGTYFAPDATTNQIAIHTAGRARFGSVRFAKQSALMDTSNFIGGEMWWGSADTLYTYKSDHTIGVVFP